MLNCFNSRKKSIKYSQYRCYSFCCGCSHSGEQGCVRWEVTVITLSWGSYDRRAIEGCSDHPRCEYKTFHFAFLSQKILICGIALDGFRYVQHFSKIKCSLSFSQFLWSSDLLWFHFIYLVVVFLIFLQVFFFPPTQSRSITSWSL